MRARAVVWTVLVAACGSSTAPTTGPVVPLPDATPVTSGAAIDAAVVEGPVAVEPLVPLPTGVPDTVAGHQLAWVIDRFAHGGTVDASAVTAHFHATFLAQVPVEHTISIFGMLGQQLGEFSVFEVNGIDVLHLTARLETKNGRLRVLLSVDAASGLIDGLRVMPDAGPQPKSFAEADVMAKAIAPRVQLLAAKLDKGVCKPVHALNSTDESAVGSAFKLYVLLGLVDRIAAHKLKWTDELAVRDDWKSLPSGITQDDAAGTKLTLQTFAERMISISDNTATDHLVYTVGRERVEAALKSAHHSKPALDQPFLTTREFMWWKLGATEAELAAYIAAKPKARRAQLTAIADKRAELAAAESWTSPRHIEDIEWFASSDDLCRVMGTLWSRAQKPALDPLLVVLSKNPGMPVGTDWTYVGFKGGSEPGVLNLTWLLRRADNAWFVVTLGFNDPKAVVDDAAALGVASGLIDLLRTQ